MIEFEWRELHFLHHRIESQIEVADVTAVTSVWAKPRLGWIVPDLSAARRTAPGHTDFLDG
jgi:hypothetical protein